MKRIKKLVDDIRGDEGFSLKDLLNGSIFTKDFMRKQYPLLLMVAVLLFFYIGNRYYCEIQMKEEIRLRRELKEVKYEYLGISAELMQVSRRSSVLRLVNERGLDLEESADRPVRIE